MPNKRFAEFSLKIDNLIKDVTKNARDNACIWDGWHNATWCTTRGAEIVVATLSEANYDDYEDTVEVFPLSVYVSIRTEADDLVEEIEIDEGKFSSIHEARGMIAAGIRTARNMPAQLQYMEKRYLRQEVDEGQKVISKSI